MKKAIKPILLTLLFSGIIYGSVVLYGQLVLLKKIGYKYLRYSFQYFTLTSARLFVTLEIINTSDIDFVIKGGDFDVYLNKTFVSKVITSGGKLAGRSTQPIVLQIDFNPTQVFKSAITALITNPGNIEITVDGKITLLSNFMILNNLKIKETVKLVDILP